MSNKVRIAAIMAADNAALSASIEDALSAEATERERQSHRSPGGVSQPSKPALTAEEWATFPNWPNATPATDDLLPIYHPSRHGIIAANNHVLRDDDPRKITRELVNTMRRAAQAIATAPLPLPSMPEDHVEYLRRGADALESYLPPEGT